MPFFVYLLECRDGTYYCGYTGDLKARIDLHNLGKASKYTRPRRPVRLVYSEPAASKGEAMSREAQIKTYSRYEKQALIESPLL